MSHLQIFFNNRAEPYSSILSPGLVSDLRTMVSRNVPGDDLKWYR